MTFIFTKNGVTKRILIDPQSIYTDVFTVQAMSVPSIKFVLTGATNVDYNYVIPFYGDNKRGGVVSDEKYEFLKTKRDEMMSTIVDAYTKHKKLVTIELP